MDLREAFQALQQVAAQAKVEEARAIEAGNLAGSAIAKIWLQIHPTLYPCTFTPRKCNEEYFLVHDGTPPYCTRSLSWVTVQSFAESVGPLIAKLTKLCVEHIKNLRAAKQVFDQIIKAIPTKPSA